jgi:hypothetical protein
LSALILNHHTEGIISPYLQQIMFQGFLSPYKKNNISEISLPLQQTIFQRVIPLTIWSSPWRNLAIFKKRMTIVQK